MFNRILQGGIAVQGIGTLQSITAGDPSHRAAPDASHLLATRMTMLLYQLRLNGPHAFSAAAGLSDLDLRLISVLGRTGPKNSTTLSRLLGRGKPQISRATSALVESGLISRTSARAPFSLTEKGEQAFAELRQVSAKRFVALSKGLTQRDIAEAVSIVADLTQFFERLLAQEQSADAEPDIDRESLAQAIDMVDDKALIPSLATLGVLIKRVFALRWKRLVGISQFDWLVLSCAARDSEIQQAELVEVTGRDKGQVSRTVNSLMSEKLLKRKNPAGMRSALLMPTARGLAIYQRTAEDAFEVDRQIGEALGHKRKEKLAQAVETMLQRASAI